MCGVFFFLFKFLSNFCFGLNLEKKYFYIKVKFFNQSTPPLSLLSAVRIRLIEKFIHLGIFENMNTGIRNDVYANETNIHNHEVIYL